MEQHEIQSKESLFNYERFNPRALEQLASATDTQGALTLEIMEFGQEQCVVARIVKMTEDMKLVYDGASQEAGVEAQADWQSWQRDMELLGGVGETEIQAVLTGKTGRQKELQVAFFGLSDGEELMSAMSDLNELRKKDGINAHEGVPEELAYLPENLLKATLEIRENSVGQLDKLLKTYRSAKNAGVLAVTNSRE